ncbi:MAG: nucleotide-binding protein [Burkholderiales bacterium]
MKFLVTACLACSVAFALSASAADAPAVVPSADGVVTGVIQEVKDVDSYTYVRLKTKDGETWAAVSKAPLKKGATISIGDAMVMNNFESKALKKTFSTIIFGNLAGSNKGVAGAPPGAAKAQDNTPIKVAKATGDNARTVAEVVTKSAELKDKSVQVRGKVVKYSPEIMGKNWIHLRDGSGSEASNTNDILVTSAGQAKLGDVVTVTGVVRVDKDFGSGYAYKVLIEEATIKP